MKIIPIDGVYEEGQVKLSQPAPVSNGRVVVNFLQEETKPKLMNEEIFWKILSLLDFNQEDPREMIRPCINHLMDFEPEDIYQFEEILAQRLYEIDGKLFAENCGDSSYRQGKYFSVDSFLYLRCGALTKGKDFYEEILHDPILFNKVLPFEPILYIAERAYKFRTGKEMEPATISYETYSNMENWK